jgi:hypothetical protein
MNTVHDLDRALHDLERDAPNATEMHQRVTDKLAAGPRAARTARLAISAAAAVVVAIAILTIALASGGGRSHQIAPGKTGSPVQTAPTSPSPTSTPTSSTAASVSSFDLLWKFRMRPVAGYTITRETIAATDQQARVTVGTGANTANKDIGGIDVYSPGVVPSDLATLIKGRHVSVNGADGYFAVTGQSSALIWRYAPGSWAEVSGDWGYDTGAASGKDQVDPAVARAGELKIAQAVVTGVQDPLRIDYTIGYLPPGLHLLRTRFYADFGGAPLCELDFADDIAGQRTPEGPAAALTIVRSALVTDNGQPGNSAFTPNSTVAGRPAEYGAGSVAVRYPYESQLDIVVDINHTTRYTKTVLTTIARHAAPAGNPADPSTWATGNDALPH